MCSKDKNGPCVVKLPDKTILSRADLPPEDTACWVVSRKLIVVRIHAIVRRSKGHTQSIIWTGKVAVNLDAKTLEVEGKTVYLKGKEYQMLELMSLRNGTTLTKEMFLNHLYGGMDVPELKIIDLFICKLRKKIAQATDNENYIQTVWGRGYVLKDADPQRQPAARLAISA